MAEMTPREQANAVRNQSRALIAALRNSRREAAAKSQVSRDAKSAAAKTVSAKTVMTRPVRAAVGMTTKVMSEPSASKGEQPVKTMARRTWEAERLRREATRNRQAAAEDVTRLREARWQSQKNARSRGGAASAAVVDPAPRPPSRAAVFANAFPGGFVAKPTTGRRPEAPAKTMSPASRAEVKTTTIERTHRPSAPRPETRAPLDIDAISGLGSALKAKLRRIGLGTVDKLSSQQPEQLRKQLGPAGRLVNIESLIRSARSAGGASAAAAASRDRRP